MRFRICCAAGTGALLAFLACTTTQEKKSDLNKDEQKKLDEYRAEVEIGRNMAGRLLQYYGTQKDESLLGYVNQVGSYVGGFSDHSERKYMFEIIDSEIVNAFACPGGYILITMGALRHAQNEAELAAILGHEITHVGNKHMFDKLKTMSAEELEKAAELAKKRMELPPSVLARERPKPEENSVVGEALAKYLAGGAAGLNIVKAAGAGMAVMLEQGLGAEKEIEADQHGVKYAINAGYEPRALSQFLCRLKKKNVKGNCQLDEQPDAKVAAKTILDKTHPPVAARIQSINEVLVKMDAKNIVGALGKKRFEKYKKRLPAKRSES